MRILLFALLSVFLTLSSCVTAKRCNDRFPPVTFTDTTYIEKIKEIPIHIPGDTININTPVNCPDQDIVSIENSKLKQQISILKGKLVSKTTIKPDTIKVYVRDVEMKTREVKVPQSVKYTPKIYLIAFWLWIGIFVGGAGYISLRFFVFKK
jgi:hypothetical protein